MKKLFVVLVLGALSRFAYSQSCDLGGADFETGSEPTGWVRSGSYVGTAAPYEGTYFVGFNTAGDMLQTEAYSCPGEICYYWRSSGFFADFDLDVEWSDDNGGTWNVVKSYSFDGSGGATTSYVKECVDLPEASYATPNGILIRFNQTRRVASSFYLDSVCVSSGVCNVTPTQLLFSNGPAGCTFTNTDYSYTVCATDASGNVATSYNGTITLSKGSGTGILSGTLSQAAVNGCATFTDLQFDQEDTYTLNASDGSLSGSSGNIDIKVSCPLTDTLKVISYNLLNFPNGASFCGGSNINITNRVDTLEKIMKYLNPDVLMVCELQDAAGADLILNSALNTDGVTKYAKANFVLNTSSGATGLNNAFFYNSEKLVLKSQSEIKTDLRDVGEYIVYGIDPNLGSLQDTTYIDFYETHLKAGSASADSLRRNEEADSMMNYINAKDPNRFNVFGGDFNLYTNTEYAYLTFTSGVNPFVDPINREGDWSSNPSFADVHTQSTRFSEQIECGATGGMDDRFDFLLLSQNIMDDTGRVKYLNGTYTALGNNGSVYNDEINHINNTSGIPDSILSALYYMSDHLPVVMDLEVTYPSLPLSIDQNTLVKESKEEGIFVFPNLCLQNEQISIKNMLENAIELEILDINGRKVKDTHFINEESIEKVNMNVQPGFYFFKVLSGDQVVYKKVVVQ